MAIAAKVRKNRAGEITFHVRPARFYNIAGVRHWRLWRGDCRTAMAQAAKTAYGLPAASVGPGPASLYDLDARCRDFNRRRATPASHAAGHPAIRLAGSRPLKRYLYVAASNGQPPTGPVGVAGKDKNQLRHRYTGLAAAYRSWFGTAGRRMAPPAIAALSGRSTSAWTAAAEYFMLTAYNTPRRGCDRPPHRTG